MDDDEFLAKRFDFAADAAKQVVTLSSAIVALTITFYKDFATGASESSRELMMAAWAAYIASILFGLIHLFQLSGALNSKNPSKRTPSNLNAKVSSVIQQVAFFIALVLTVLGGWLAIGHNGAPSNLMPPGLTSPSSPAPDPEPLPPVNIVPPLPDTGPLPPH
jgi:hypothetical protein